MEVIIGCFDSWSNCYGWKVLFFGIKSGNGAFFVGVRGASDVDTDRVFQPY